MARPPPSRWARGSVFASARSGGLGHDRVSRPTLPHGLHSGAPPGGAAWGSAPSNPGILRSSSRAGGGASRWLDAAGHRCRPSASRRVRRLGGLSGGRRRRAVGFIRGSWTNGPRKHGPVTRIPDGRLAALVPAQQQVAARNQVVVPGVGRRGVAPVARPHPFTGIGRSSDHHRPTYLVGARRCRTPYHATVSLLPPTGQKPIQSSPSKGATMSTGSRETAQAKGAECDPKPQQVPAEAPDLTLRRMIGLLGTLLPFVLLFGGHLSPSGLLMRKSISAYYYTAVGYLFVGILLVTGAFLICYRGYPESAPKCPESKRCAGIRKWCPWIRDDGLTSVAGLLAILVAVLPAAACGQEPDLVNKAHWVLAGAFLLATAVMSHCQFTLGGENHTLYSVCAGLILAAVLVILGDFLTGEHLQEWCPTIVWWLEAVAVVAFGFSWLVKSELIRSRPRQLVALLTLLVLFWVASRLVPSSGP